MDASSCHAHPRSQLTPSRPRSPPSPPPPLPPPPCSLRASAKYGDEGRFFDLSDLENTIGSWDMYGQQDASRYNGLQAEFFERAAGGLTRREYLNALCALGGGAAILVWGAKGSADAGLPITKGPQKGGEAGPRGRK